MSIPTPSTWSEAIVWAFVHFLWQGSALALLLALALRLQRRAPAQVRYATACAALAAQALLVPLTVLRLYATSPPELPAFHRPPDTAAFQSPAVPGTFQSLLSAPESERPERFERGTGPAAPARSTPSPGIVPAVSVRMTAWISAHAERLLACWFLGALLLSLRFAMGTCQIASLRRASWRLSGSELEEALVRLSGRLGIRKAVRLRAHRRLGSAVTFGWLRPVVLLPASALIALPPAHLEAILAHELAHIRRHDYLVNLVQSAVEVLLFFHPAVWWVSSVIRREREHCCDDLAAAAVSGGAPVLARALAGLAELRSDLPAPALGVRGGSLLTRVRRLTGAGDPAGRGPERSGRWLAGLFCAFLLGAGALTGHAVSPDGTETTAPLTESDAPPVPAPAPGPAPAAASSVDRETQVATSPRAALTPPPSLTPAASAHGQKPGAGLSGKFTIVLLETRDLDRATEMVYMLHASRITHARILKTGGLYDPVFLAVPGVYETRALAEQARDALTRDSYVDLSPAIRELTGAEETIFEAAKFASARPRIMTRVFPLRPGPKDIRSSAPSPAAAQEIADILQDMLSRDEESTPPRHRLPHDQPRGQKRFWFDPELQMLTVADTEENHRRVEEFLGRPWVKRRLGMADRAGTSTVALLAPGQVLRFGDLAIRLEKFLMPEEDRSRPRIEILARFARLAEILTPRLHDSVSVGPPEAAYSVTFVGMTRTADAEGAGDAALVEIWRPLSPGLTPGGVVADAGADHP